MKFRIALAVSIILHVSVFLLIMVVPDMDTGDETTYYVDLISMPGGGGGPGNGTGGGNGGAVLEERAPGSDEPAAAEIEDAGTSVRELTVKKQAETRLRYPDKKNRRKQESKKKALVSVVKRKKRKTADPVSVRRRTSGTGRKGVLSTGISSAGSGSGGGGGSGGGFGGSGNFPYAYYISALKGKISSSWYNAVVGPGVRGRFIAGVYFKIMRNGRVRDVKLEKRSGKSALDLSALRAVENASPFPPLPRDFPYSYLVVHFEFLWEKK